MNKLLKSSIRRGRPLNFVKDTDFSDYPLRYPIHKVNSCHYEVSVLNSGDYTEADYHIEASLHVEDSRDATLFDYDLEIDEAADLLDEEDSVGEGFLTPGEEIDLDDVALRLIESYLPIQLYHEGPSLLHDPHFLTKEEYEKQQKELSPSPFDNIEIEEDDEEDK